MDDEIDNDKSIYAEGFEQKIRSHRMKNPCLKYFLILENEFNNDIPKMKQMMLQNKSEHTIALKEINRHMMEILKIIQEMGTIKLLYDALSEL